MMKNLFFLVLALVFTHANSQKFINSHTVGNKTKIYAKVLVVAKVKDNKKRIELEDDIVARLEKKGIKAMASHIKISSKMLKQNGKNEKALETFASELKNRGFEGILVTSLVDSDTSVEYNPATYNTTRVPVRYGRFGRYYGTANVKTYTPGTVKKHREFVLESLLYDLRGSTKENSLHWLGKLKVTDPTSFDKASDKYAKKLVKRLVKEAIDL